MREDKVVDTKVLVEDAAVLSHSLHLYERIGRKVQRDVGQFHIGVGPLTHEQKTREAWDQVTLVP